MGKTELKIDADLVAEAEAAGLKVEQLAEGALRRALAEADRFRGLSDAEKANKWAEENADALKAQRERIDEYGVFGEDLRTS